MELSTSIIVFDIFYYLPSILTNLSNVKNWPL